MFDMSAPRPKHTLTDPRAHTHACTRARIRALMQRLRARLASIAVESNKLLRSVQTRTMCGRICSTTHTHTHTHTRSLPLLLELPFIYSKKSKPANIMYKVCINAKHGILRVMSCHFILFFYISQSRINLVTSHGAKLFIKLYLDVSHLKLQRSAGLPWLPKINSGSDSFIIASYWLAFDVLRFVDGSEKVKDFPLHYSAFVL